MSTERSLRLDQAQAHLASALNPVAGIEEVPLAQAAGRVLAAEILSRRSLPPADNSAVDGYAFRHADLPVEGMGRFALVGRSAAGHPYPGDVAPGQTVRILTGALLPRGTDSIAMQEDAIVEEGAVLVPSRLRHGANRRRAGEDVPAGAAVLPAGLRLAPRHLGPLAAAGWDERIPVRRPLSVALFSNGDELVEAGQPARAEQITDANRPMVAGLLTGLGCRVSDLGILPDDRGRMAAILAKAAAGHDCVIGTAGMSQGDEDHARAAIASVGSLEFWSIAVKPGRPVAFGRIGSTPYLGLPGNPASALTAFLMIARPALLRLAGAAVEPLHHYPVTAGFGWRKRPGRREFVRVSLDRTVFPPLARRLVRDTSGIFAAAAMSDGLLDLAEESCDLQPGAIATFLPFHQFGL